MTFAALAVLVVTVVVVAVVWAAVRRNGRTKAFATWAEANGFSYAQRDKSLERLPWGDPWDRGSGRRATDVLIACAGDRTLRSFDYQYTVSNGDSSATYHFSVFWIQLPKPLGQLSVGRATLRTKLKRAVGFRDLELESEEFNRAYAISGPDRKFAYDVLNPPMMQWLLDSDAPGFRLFGADLVLVLPGRLQLGDVPVQLGYLSEVAGRIPSVVWNAR